MEVTELGDGMRRIKEGKRKRLISRLSASLGSQWIIMSSENMRKKHRCGEDEESTFRHFEFEEFAYIQVLISCM